MTDLEHPVTARLLPAGDTDLFQDLLALGAAGRLGPILGQDAPERHVLDDGAQVYAGAGLFVLFDARPGSGELQFSICRRRDSTCAPDDFAETARALGLRLLRFLLAVLDIDAVLDGPNQDRDRTAEPRLTGPVDAAPLPRRERNRETARPERPPDISNGRPFPPPKLTGHGAMPELPSQSGLRMAMAMRRPAALTVRAWHVPVAAMLAVPLMLALLAGRESAGQPILHLWGKRGFELSDLTNYRQTSAELVPERTEAAP